MAHRSGRSLRPALALLVVPLGLASLAYSVQFTPADPHTAYFSTLTRIWELALGGGLALALPLGLRLARPASALLAGGGLAVLIFSAFAFDGQTPYPGWRALLPTLATAAIIVAGTAQAVSGPIRILTVGPMQYLGKISYSWYLWHWPAVVFATEAFGGLTWLGLLLVTLLAWVPAAASHHAIEERFRRSRSLGRRPRRALAIGVGFTVAAVLLGVGLQRSQPRVPTASPSAALGAMAVGPRAIVQSEAPAVRPNPRHAAGDKGKLFEDGCVLLKDETDPPPCVYGERSSDTTVVLFGDSHALQYFPTLNKLAHSRGWRLVGLVRAGCVIAEVPYERVCTRWRRKAMRRILRKERPSLVVISQSTGGRYQVMRDGERLDRRASQPHLQRGFARTLRRLRRDSRVAVIRDQALAPFNPPECVAGHMDDLDACSFRAKRRISRSFDARAAWKVRGVRLIDPLPVLCPRGRCRSVMGNVLVYRDTYHLTPTYARTLSRWLGRKLPPPKRR